MTSTAHEDQFLPHPDDVAQDRAQEIRNAALEEAASVCDALERDNDNCSNTSITDRSTAWQFNYCAAQIRALKSAPAAQASAEAVPRGIIDAARQAGFAFHRHADGSYTMQPIKMATAQAENSAKGAGDVAQPKRRPYNASASLSEYGVFPECDAAPAAQQQQPGIGPMPPMNQ